MSYIIRLEYRPGVVSRFVNAARDEPLEYVVLAERLRAFEKWLMKNYSTMYESFPANHELADKLLLAAHDRIQVAFTVEKRLKVWWKHWLSAETYVLTIHDLRLTPFPTA